MKSGRSKRSAASSSAAAIAGVLVAMVALPPVALALCGSSSVVRDYLSTVKQSAPIREIPALDQLPFAPAGLHLEVIGGGLTTEDKSIGYSFSNRSASRRQVNLIIESELLKVSPRGRVLLSLGLRQRNLGSIRGHTSMKLLQHVSATPAYYRTDIRIHRAGQRRVLANYSFYTRVMRPRVDLRVKIETPTVVPGEVARATILNLGTVPLTTPSYDYGFGVQAFTGEKWIRVLDNPKRHVPKRPATRTLSAGMENRGCLRYLVPGDQAPGLFRFAAFGVPGEVPLSAEFEVLRPE